MSTIIGLWIYGDRAHVIESAWGGGEGTGFVILCYMG